MRNPYQTPLSDSPPPGTNRRRFTDLPTVCPNCNRSLGPIKPERKWQRKAVMLFIAGWLASMVWAYALFEILFSREQFITAVHFIILICLACLPCFGMGLIAANMRKVVQLKCFHCKWTERYVLDKG